MTKFKYRTIKANEKWVEITRDNERRVFHFEVGDEGSKVSQYVFEHSFSKCGNWAEAERRSVSFLIY
jgi:hypothetical protein